MGFGYGRTTHWSDDARDRDGNRVRKVYDSSMVAHVWNAESQDFARTSNGNFAFRGNEVYSYGTGWIVAKRFAGIVLLNCQRYSVTTSGHLSDARRASSDRVQYELPELPSDFARELDRIERERGKAERKRLVRALIARPAFRAIMAATPAGRYVDAPLPDKPWNIEYVPSDAPPLGAWLAEYVGLKASEYHNAAARLVAAAEREAEKAKREEHKRFVARSIRWADMSDSDFREKVSTRDRWRSHAILEIARELRAARLKAGLSDKRRRVLLARERKARAIQADYARLSEIANKRSRLAALVRYVRQHSNLLAISNDRPLTVWSSPTWRTLRDNLESLSECRIIPAESRAKLLSLSRACRAEAVRAEEREAAEREAERQERLRDAAERAERVAANRAAWIAGDELPYPHAGTGRDQFSRDDGTPYLRIEGDTLATSWGAQVPLAHAIKAYRFVKLCRERGERWQRNGHTIRVGHFQVDSINPDGSFTAGCHRFAWEEIERAARMAGVADMGASRDAEVTSH